MILSRENDILAETLGFMLFTGIFEQQSHCREAGRALDFPVIMSLSRELIGHMPLDQSGCVSTQRWSRENSMNEAIQQTLLTKEPSLPTGTLRWRVNFLKHLKTI
jgi:hypothetical protein